MMRGAGEEVGPALGLAPLFAALVNPGIPVETPSVFRTLDLKAGDALAGAAHPPIPVGRDAVALLAALASAGNDLEAPARAAEPVVGEALSLVAATQGCCLARMSGSGATVFGLYADRRTAVDAVKALRRTRPRWWVKATMLGGSFKQLPCLLSVELNNFCWNSTSMSWALAASANWPTVNVILKHNNAI